jgi:hypothetical protein
MHFTRELSKATVMMMHTDTGECATHVQIGTHISDPIRPVKFSHTESQTPSNTHTHTAICAGRPSRGGCETNSPERFCVAARRGEGVISALFWWIVKLFANVSSPPNHHISYGNKLTGKHLKLMVLMLIDLGTLSDN